MKKIITKITKIMSIFLLTALLLITPVIAEENTGILTLQCSEKVFKAYFIDNNLNNVNLLDSNGNILPCINGYNYDAAIDFASYHLEKPSNCIKVMTAKKTTYFLVHFPKDGNDIIQDISVINDPYTTITHSIEIQCSEKDFTVAFLNAENNAVPVINNNKIIDNFNGKDGKFTINFNEFKLIDKPVKIKIEANCDISYDSQIINFPMKTQTINVKFELPPKPSIPTEDMEAINVICNAKDVMISIGTMEHGKFVVGESKHVTNGQHRFTVPKNIYTHVKVEAIEFKKEYVSAEIKKIQRNSDDGITVMHVELYTWTL